MSDAFEYRESPDHSRRRFEEEHLQTSGPVAGTAGPNMGLALVTSLSPVNRVVVSRIVEGAGLKALCSTLQNAQRSLLACRPGMVIVDCGCDDSEDDSFAPAFERSRAMMGGSLPLLIMLSTNATQTVSKVLAGSADAIVPKPITVEGLQPVMLRLIEAARR